MPMKCGHKGCASHVANPMIERIKIFALVALVKQKRCGGQNKLEVVKVGSA